MISASIESEILIVVTVVTYFMNFLVNMLEKK